MRKTFLFILLISAQVLSMSIASTRLDGADLYQRFCANCHDQSEQTRGIWYPHLADIVEQTEPEHLVDLIDHGQFRRAGETLEEGRPFQTIPIMPSWSWLTDAELAHLVNFLVDRYGSGTVKLSAIEVRALRDESEGTELSETDRSAAHHLYLSHCAGCHGADRQGIVGPPLSQWPLANLSMEAIRSTLHYGTLDGMPEWGVSVQLTAHQMTLLARYLQAPALAQDPAFTLKHIRESWSAPNDHLATHRFKAPYIITLLHDGGRALFIDPVQKKIIGQVEIESAPYHLLQDSAVWILTRGGWIVQIDPGTRQVRTRVRAGYEATAFALGQRKRASKPLQYLAVTTTSPPGLSFFDADTLEPLDRVETIEPMGPVLGEGNLKAVMARYSGCIYPIADMQLIEDCIEGVRYPRYASAVPATSLYFLIGEMGELAVFNADTLEIVARLDLGMGFTPGRGSIVNHPEYGRVFVVASMTSKDIMVVGADPATRPTQAWKILQTIEALDSGSLFVAGHPESRFVLVDSPLGASHPGSVLLLDRTQQFSTTHIEIAEQAELKGTPRVLQPLFDPDGREVWLTIWNRMDETSALALLNPETQQLETIIKDFRLTSPLRSYWIAPTTRP